jgi:hypothetical protein
MRIEPKCFAFYSDGRPKKTDHGDEMKNCVAFASNGYLVPCCWMDKYKNSSTNVHNLWDKELQINGVQDVETVLKSKQWKDFYRLLFEEPEKACDTCKENCGIDDKEYLND